MSDAADRPSPRGRTGKELFERLEAEFPGLSEETDRLEQQSGPIGRQLLRARLERKLTQQELADRSGVRQADISELECGGGNPTRATLEKLGVALGIDFIVGVSSAA
jgi:ribosome-binding protein aMBF1 (putative translation factor)